MASLSITLTKDRTYPVNFTCQRCCQPLKLDSSFDTIDEQTVLDLSERMHNQQEPSESTLSAPALRYRFSEDESAVSRRTVRSSRLVETGNGFLLVEDNMEDSSREIQFNHIRQVNAQLFDIMTDQSDVDYPICEECTDNLLDQMERQLDLAEDECKDYKKYLEQLTTDENEEDLVQLDAELRTLELRERQLLEQIEQVERERSSIQEERNNYAEELERLQVEEERYLREQSDLKRQLLLCADDQVSVDTQLRYAHAQMEKLHKTNVFNATFHIWHEGHFGTINNFRLGRLPNVPVEWSEINVAWGQTVLLLHSLARKVNLTFERYRLVPYGNHSYLECLEDRSRELPLHFAGGFKFLWDNKFDMAMVAFLDCLQQFREHVERGNPDYCLPYRMDKGKIEDVQTGQSCSIKIQFNSEEHWTKALKFMLTNLKWGLAWVSSQFANS